MLNSRNATLLAACLAVVNASAMAEIRRSEASSWLDKAARTEARHSVNVLSRDIQSLKTSVIDLNKDIRLLEENLLFPANTQLSVFLSLDSGYFFALDSVKLKIDGQLVTSHLYSEGELTALEKGGVHRLYLGNISDGVHEITAIFNGSGPMGRAYQRGATHRVEKRQGPKYVQLAITDSGAKQQPKFAVKEW